MTEGTLQELNTAVPVAGLHTTLSTWLVIAIRLRKSGIAEISIASLAANIQISKNK